MSGRSFGYARVSTDDQDLTLQLDALTRQGIAASRIFKDNCPERGPTGPA
jgi:DNA invertase Pin-like site-specific DNA recombinase